jgi:hypothetical protein
VCDLCEAGYVTKERNGRRNCYVVNLHGGLRHPLVERHSARELVAQLAA